jgi:arylsulfatase A-like enzyme
METNSSRRDFLKTTGFILAGAAVGTRIEWAWASDKKPNVILIYCDDMGYGDIGAFGSSIPTPNIDSIATDGVRFTHFSASPTCSPSRAGLMTGRYCTRVGVPQVLQSNSEGLALSETTMADVFKSRGYKTMCIGKWHLGDVEGYLPTERGFDEYYGIPYSNDIAPVKLMHNTETIEYPVNQETLTRRYTEQALKFINGSKDDSFFLYFPHTFPHTPLAASDDYEGKTGMGLYADVVAELDWSVGEILAALKKYGLEENTLVIFTSDNGPATGEGSTGGLRGRKFTTYEGGVREPFVAKWPGQIPAGKTVEGVAATIDLLPTFAGLVGASLPEKPLDGINIWPMFSGKQQQMDRKALLYWSGWNIEAARLGNWKLRFKAASSGMGGGMGSPPGGQGGQGGGMGGNAPAGGGMQGGTGGTGGAMGQNAGAGGGPNAQGAGQGQGGGMDSGMISKQAGSVPSLHNLELDPYESYNSAAAHPDIVADITRRVEELVPGFPETVQEAWAEIKTSWADI